MAYPLRDAECPACQGAGVGYERLMDSVPVKPTCPRCKGSGRIQITYVDRPANMKWVARAIGFLILIGGLLTIWKAATR